MKPVAAMVVAIASIIIYSLLTLSFNHWTPVIILLLIAAAIGVLLTGGK